MLRNIRCRRCRKCSEIYFIVGSCFSIILYSARLIVPLDKLLRLGNEKKNKFSFCISLDFS